MEMKTYHCDNPAEIHLSNSKKLKDIKVEKKPDDLIQKFKANPGSFFSSIIPPAKPRSN